jgi:hypothetical protein
VFIAVLVDPARVLSFGVCDVVVPLAKSTRVGRSGDMEGDRTPPPPTPYQSPSIRRKAARESKRRVHRGEKGLPLGVLESYVSKEPYAALIKEEGAGEQETLTDQIVSTTQVYDPGRSGNQDLHTRMASQRKNQGRMARRRTRSR